MTKIDWTDLHIFLAIVEAGSISGAAKALNMSQPTVGRHLNALEDAAGTSLFARSTRALKLTDSGEAILENARRMGVEALTIERLLEGHVKTLSGLVKITAVEGLGTHWLPREIAIFNERYPDITIEIQIGNRVVDLQRREADIALRLVRPYQGDLIAKKLTSYGFGLYADKGYLERHGVPVGVEDLAQHQMVGMPHQVFRDIGFGADEWEHISQAKTVVQTNSPSAHIEATCAGLGIGLHSHRWASSYSNLLRVLPQINLDKVGVWIVSHEDLRHSARIRAVFDFLSERIIAQKSLFEEGRRP